MSNINNNKKKLSPEQREQLLRILKVRFEKNLPTGQAGINRHKGLEWTKVQAKLEASPSTVGEKLWSLNEMERTGGEPDVVGYDNLPAARQERQANTFFMIVHRKVRMDEEMFVTIEKRWSRGKNINRKIALWIWQLQWALSF